MGAAAWLQERSIIFQRLNFGRVLGILNYFLRNQIQVLGFRNGWLVPYTQSEQYEKLVNASAQRPTGLRDGEAYVSTWQDLRKRMSELLTANGGSMKIECLKKDFREKFEMQL